MTSLSSSGSFGSSCSRSRPESSSTRVSRAVASAANDGVLAGELAGRAEVAAGLVERPGRLDQRRELGVAATEPAGARLVGVHRRVGELALQGGVLGEQVAQHVAVAAAHLTLPPSG